MEKSNFKIIVAVALAVIAAAAIVLLLNKNYDKRIAEKYENGSSVSQENTSKPSQSLPNPLPNLFPKQSKKETRRILKYL